MEVRKNTAFTNKKSKQLNGIENIHQAPLHQKINYNYKYCQHIGWTVKRREALTF